MKVVYTPESIEDLNRLRDFIKTENPDAAQRTAGLLLEGVKKLKQFPQIGIEVSQAPNPKLIRDLILGNYIVRYLILDKTIYILRAWHHKEEGRSGL